MGANRSEKFDLLTMLASSLARTWSQRLTPLLKYVSKTFRPQSLLFSSGASWYMACRRRTDRKVWTNQSGRGRHTQSAIFNIPACKVRERGEASKSGLMRNKSERKKLKQKWVRDSRRIKRNGRGGKTSHLVRGSELAVVFIFTLRLCICHLAGLGFHPVAPWQIVFWVKCGCRQGMSAPAGHLLLENKLWSLDESMDSMPFTQKLKVPKCIYQCFLRVIWVFVQSVNFN